MKALMLPFLVVAALAGCGSDDGSQPERLRQISSNAQSAYIYGYPLLVMEYTRQVSTAVEAPDGSRAPMNQLAHIRTFPTPEFKDVVSPNVDTLYSIAWLDLEREPYVLSVPDAAGFAPAGSADPRYYLLQMLDGWTNVFDSPGLRTRGPGARTYLLTGPSWQGNAPTGMERISSPTQLVWMTGRTQALDAADLPIVHTFQDAIRLVPLSRWDQPETPPAPVPIDKDIDLSTPPMAQVEALSADAFFSQLAVLMRTNPPASDDGPMLQALATLGLTPGQPYELAAQPAEVASAIRLGYQAGQARLRAMAGQSADPVNGWTVMTTGIGEYGSDYDTRAVVARVGLGANLPEDAVYPRTAIDGTGRPLSNAHRYTLSFPPGQLPPANAFWSLTMYDDDQALVANPIERYAIGDRSPLVFEPGGSLILRIQKDAPAGASAANWLPTPQDDTQDFNLILRIYWPQAAMLDGSWRTPPVVRVE